MANDNHDLNRRNIEIANAAGTVLDAAHLEELICSISPADSDHRVEPIETNKLGGQLSLVASEIESTNPGLSADDKQDLMVRLISSLIVEGTQETIDKGSSTHRSVDMVQATLKTLLMGGSVPPVAVIESWKDLSGLEAAPQHTVPEVLSNGKTVTSGDHDITLLSDQALAELAQVDYSAFDQFKYGDDKHLFVKLLGPQQSIFVGVLRQSSNRVEAVRVWDFRDGAWVEGGDLDTRLSNGNVSRPEVVKDFLLAARDISKSMSQGLSGPSF